MSKIPSILVAEDDPTDAFFLERAFSECGEKNRLQFVHDGQDLIDALEKEVNEGAGRLPTLIMLDLKMPRVTGIEFLEWRREHPVFGCIPTLVFSSSLQDEDIERCYALGANIFLSKPNSIDDRLEVVRFVIAWAKLGKPALATVAGFSAAERAHARFGIPTETDTPAQT
jgi:two-component system response regulator